MGNDHVLGDVTAIPEHDKLGPLGTRTSVLGGGGDLRDALVGEFRDSIERARRASADVGTSSTIAVHEYRKALRRARAVLELVAPALPPDEARTIRDVLRTARRALSTARDQAVAPDAIASLVLDDGERATAEAVLATARDAAPAQVEIARLLVDGASRAAAQSLALETALPGTIEWTLIEDGLRRTYLRARRARRKAKRDLRSFHAWRRRTKELMHQLDLVARHAGPRAATLRDDVEAVSDAMGGAVDLIMLRELVETYGCDQEGLDELDEAIDARIETAVRQCRRAGKTLFAKGGRRFTKRVAKAVRKDLAPPAAASA